MIVIAGQAAQISERLGHIAIDSLIALTVILLNKLSVIRYE